MRNEMTNHSATAIIGVTGAAVAVNPLPFYETESWLTLMAIGGAVVLVLALINSLYTLKQNVKYTGKERRKEDRS